MKSSLCLALCIAWICTHSGIALAQYSKDASTETMEQSNLFVAHSNFCNSSTEAFVSTGPGSSLGFCIDKNVGGGGTVSFEVARRYCINLGERLPEPMEYKDACLNAGYFGISSMPNSTGEWVSNFTTYGNDPSASSGSTYKTSVLVPVVINTCKTSDLGAALGYNGVESLRKYRCVR
jgi:hypothetical protein